MNHTQDFTRENVKKYLDKQLESYPETEITVRERKDGKIYVKIYNMEADAKAVCKNFVQVKSLSNEFEDEMCASEPLN